MPSDFFQVMTELWKGKRFLQRATDEQGQPFGKLAIISYRCVPRHDDAFTLDAFALRSAVLAAQQNDVEFLWLDAWAYRKQPPWAEYEHSDFMRTLLAVMLRVSHVIWLPRSRLDAEGECKPPSDSTLSPLASRLSPLASADGWRSVSHGADQYRIWCTFEATIVHLRRLPVTAAAHGPCLPLSALECTLECP